MGGMRFAGDLILHQLDIAVIGGDQQDTAGFFHRLPQPAEAGVDGFHRSDGGRHDPGMTDHIGIGVIDDDEVVFVRSDGFDQPVGDFGRRHFGLQIIGGDFRARHQDAVFAGKLRLASAVHEKRHMSVFLGLGETQLFQAVFGENLAQRFC